MRREIARSSRRAEDAAAAAESAVPVGTGEAAVQRDLIQLVSVSFPQIGIETAIAFHVLTSRVL